MVFYTGTANNSQDLWDIIDGYITSTPGWSLHATISSKDKVYRSEGSSGNERIYARMSTGRTDKHRIGSILKHSSMGDGYTNSLAFNIYQYFSDTNLDGYNELGVFGPEVFFYRGSGTSQVWAGDWQNSNADPQGVFYWDRLPDGSYTFSADHNNTNSAYHTFDGKRYIYSTSDSLLQKYDIVEGGSTTLASSPAGRVMGTTYVVNSSTGTEHLYGGTSSATSGQQFVRYNIQSNNWQYVANPPWNTSTDSRSSAWDGYNTLYVGRGGNLNQFAYYNIPNDTWAWGPPFPWTTQYGSVLIYVPANAENGLPQDALYVTRGLNTSNFARLYINANGTPSGSWTALASAPNEFWAGTDGFYAGGDYIFVTHGADNSDGQRTVSKYKISTSTWSNVNINTVPFSQFGGGGGFIFSNHQTYVPASDEGSQTEFWYFADEDHIIIVTKDSNGVYDYIYLGIIDSYYSRLSASLTTSASSGSGVIVAVDDASIFSAGQKVMISDMSDGAGAFTEQVGTDLVSRKFYPAEMTQIDKISGNNLTLANLKNSYPIGARIGVDPQPVGLTGYRSNRIQMLNHVNINLSGASSGLVPQIYKYNCPVSAEITAQSAEEDRTEQYMLWPLVVSNSRDFAGEEVRGQMKGVYIVDGGGTAEAGDLVTFLGENYLLFQFDSGHYSEGRLFAFGPV